MPTLKEAFAKSETVARADRVRPNTLRILDVTRRSFIDHYGPDADLGTLDLSSFKAAHANLSRATVNQRLRTLKPAASVCGVDLKVTQLRVSRKRPNRLTDEEIERLLSVAGRLYPILVTAVDSGMRRAEIVYLKWSEVDLKEKMAIVHDAKNGDARAVIITQRVVKALEHLPYGKWVFRRTRYQDEPYTLNALSNAVRDRFRKAGLLHIPGAGLHCLRRTFTARCAELGVPMPVVRDQLGHASLATTERHYLSVSEAAMRKSLEVLDK